MIEGGLVVDNVSATFDGTAVLAAVSLQVPRSSACALIGGNGAGKTTLLNVCLGFVPVAAGSVTIDGLDVQANAVAAKERLAFVPEVTSLYPRMSAVENLAFFEGLMGRSHLTDDYIDVLGRLRFPTARANAPTRTYSKGMRQKVALAIGLMKGATVFLLDEPDSGLDPESARDLTHAISGLAAAGKAVLFTTHDIAAAERCAGSIVKLEEGRVVHSQANAGGGA